MASRRSMRDTSKRLFGNRYMLEVCLAIAQSRGRVNLTQLVHRAGVSPSVYSGPISRLTDLGLLVEDPRAGDDRRTRWYARARSSLWKAVKELGA